MQTKTVRDAAAMLDCLAIPQPGDPFFIPTPSEPYATLDAATAVGGSAIGWSTTPLMGVAVDTEVAEAVRSTARLLEAMGHTSSRASPAFDGLAAMRAMTDVWFFGFDRSAGGLLGAQRPADRTGHPRTGGPQHLRAREADEGRAVPGSDGAINAARRQLGRFFSSHDIWLSPTTPRVAEPWGTYNLGRTDVTLENLVDVIYRRPASSRCRTT